VRRPAALPLPSRRDAMFFRKQELQFTTKPDEPAAAHARRLEKMSGTVKDVTSKK
jgi:hypothetical protein